eukprot:4743692-Pleurochrysis_carterae.AAC.1
MTFQQPARLAHSCSSPKPSAWVAPLAVVAIPVVELVIRIAFITTWGLDSAVTWGRCAAEEPRHTCDCCILPPSMFSVHVDQGKAERVAAASLGVKAHPADEAARVPRKPRHMGRLMSCLILIC